MTMIFLKVPAAAIAAGGLFLAATPASADSTPESDIIVTGTRTSSLRAEDSLAPVQILDAATLERDASGALINALANALPSLNLQAVGFDLANSTLSVRMRGLSPNHTLVLVNGKRLHGTANLAVLSGPFQGGAAPDLNFVPLSSVRRVEVLQDGAAAQYGSDAIAGVLNIMLDSDASGGSMSLSHGGYYRGDGITTDAAANLGLPLGTSGYLNLSGTYRDHGFSNAGGPDQRVERAIASGEHPEYRDLEDYPLVNKVFGDTRNRTYLATINAALPLADVGEVYAFGTYGHKKSGGWANFRLPTKLPALYPNGFSPIDWVISDDLSITSGVRGKAGPWSLDLSSTYGFNYNRVEVTGSANLDLYADTGTTPVDFYNGNLDGSQWTVNFDAHRPLAIGLAQPATLAFGAEYRRETYSIAAGDEASRYKAGSQSFPGFSLSDAGSTDRIVKAAYADLAFAPSSALQIDVAARYEDYSDFGDAVVGKFSGRFEVNSELAFRGTFSTGFRAPTLAEGRYSATNVQPNSAYVQLPPNSNAARLIGIDPLKPEKSTNLNFGIVAKPMGSVNLSLDVYQIEIRDRVVGSGTLYGTYAGNLRSAAVNAAIVANGNTLEAVPFSGVNIFSNGIDTRARGIDLVLGLRTPLGHGRIDWSLAANYNHVKVTKVRDTPVELSASGQQLFDPVAISNLETASPRLNVVLATNYVAGPLTITLRNALYGQSSRYTDPGDGKYYIDRTGTKLITDLAVSYRLGDRVTLSVGANNLFNIFPDRVDPQGLAASAAAGNPSVEIYPSFSSFGINGGYYFGKISMDF
jgi:iron complex outermembrane receptor protein